MKYTSVRAVLGVVVLMFLMQANPQDLCAQTTNGTILGTVRDSAGGIVPGANVSARSTETGVVRSVATDSSGAYQILSLPAGAYDVEAAYRGFKTEVRKGVVVTVAAPATANFTLAVGDVQEKVVVTANPQELNTTDASTGGLVGETAVRELPLNGRDWIQLATLQAGVVGGIGQQSAAASTNSRAARGNGVALDISGNRPTGNVFLVDGLIVNDQANGSPESRSMNWTPPPGPSRMSLLTRTLIRRNSGGRASRALKSPQGSRPADISTAVFLTMRAILRWMRATSLIPARQRSPTVKMAEGRHSGATSSAARRVGPSRRARLLSLAILRRSGK